MKNVDDLRALKTFYGNVKTKTELEMYKKFNCEEKSGIIVHIGS